MERWELENTHAYRIYQNTHRGQYKGTETEVEKQERFKFRSVLFHCIMKHMLSKMHEETTIYYLMKEINCLHNCNKQSKKQ